jgi:diguanylate cyclase (GGDEF)-like protein/PAS domain S-box-containing protein
MSGETILIVEDEALIALHLKRVLSGFGYGVLQTVDTGAEAIRWAELLHPDLILMDIQLRGEMDGIETARQIRARLDLPVVFLTAFAEDSRLTQARTTGPYGYLVKPIQERELRSTLEMALYKHKLDMKLKESEMAYRELYHSTPAMLHTTDMEGRILQVSDYWLSMLGYTRNDVLGRQITDFVTGSSCSIFLEKYIPRMARSGSTRDAECQFVKCNGHVIDALFSAVSVFDDQDRLLYTHSAIVDITARKRAEAAERDQRALAEALRDTAAALNTTLSLEEVLARVLAHVGKVVPYHAVNVMMVEEGKAHIVRSDGFRELGREEEAIATPVNIADYPHLRMIAESGQPVYFSDTIAVAGWDMPWARSYAGAPIMVKRRLVGFINLFSLDPNYYSPDLVSRLQAFADQAAIAIENANLYAEVQRLATLDELTNVFNRRRLFELGERELERSRRYQMPLSAILLDIDHFKKINDTYGHTTGDRVLTGIAAVISRNIREIDLFGRYGGEEFVVLLPQAEFGPAREVAERLRMLVSELSFHTERGELSVTISLGIAGITAEVHSLATLIDRADQAMYAAKQAGRNRVAEYH